MASFKEGHTTNIGTTYSTARARRIMKRKEREALIESLVPQDLISLPKKDYSKQTAILLANRSPGKPFEKGHAKFPNGGVGKEKRTASIKTRIVSELKKTGTADAISIARRLINMAKAGDLKAIEMIMDRVDGKVPTTIGGDKDNPLVITIEPVLSAKYSKNANTIPNANLPGPS